MTSPEPPSMEEVARRTAPLLRALAEWSASRKAGDEPAGDEAGATGPTAA